MGVIILILIIMKLLFSFSTFIVLMMVSSCNQSNDRLVLTDDFSKEIVELKAFHKDGLNLATSVFKKNLTLNSSNDLILNEQGLISDVLNGLKGTHFTASDDFVASLSSSYASRNLTVNGISNARQSVSSTDLDQFFNEGQKQLVQPFLNELLSTDDFTKAKSLALTFQDKVIASPLVREDKIKVLSLAVGIQVLSEFFLEAGDEQIRAIILSLIQLKDSKSSSNARVSKGCELSARSILTDAVVGFFGSGIGGAITGCTVGSVTVPIIGTVTGCVSGAVVGAAYGFVGGAITSAVSGLLQTCFR
jgi:hypothetical protein